MQENKDAKSLPFFGIPKMVPYLKDYRGMMLIMVTTGLFGSAVDIILPLYQRYALNHFVGERRWIRFPGS